MIKYLINFAFLYFAINWKIHTFFHQHPLPFLRYWIFSLFISFPTFFCFFSSPSLFCGLIALLLPWSSGLVGWYTNYLTGFCLSCCQEAREISLSQVQAFTKPVIFKCKEVNFWVYIIGLWIAFCVQFSDYSSVNAFFGFSLRCWSWYLCHF